MKTAIAVILTLTLAPAGALAQHHSHSSGHGPASMMAGSTEASEGVVQKIDKGAGKITLKHGEIKNLGMPPMTMVFRVKDAGMLDRVKVGDKVRFHAEQPEGTYTVMAIDAMK